MKKNILANALVFCLFVCTNAFSQKHTSEKDKEEKTVELTIVKNKNGNQVVIDTSFVVTEKFNESDFLKKYGVSINLTDNESIKDSITKDKNAAILNRKKIIAVYATDEKEESYTWSSADTVNFGDQQLYIINNPAGKGMNEVFIVMNIDDNIPEHKMVRIIRSGNGNELNYTMEFEQIDSLLGKYFKWIEKEDDTMENVVKGKVKVEDKKEK